MKKPTLGQLYMDIDMGRFPIGKISKADALKLTGCNEGQYSSCVSYYLSKKVEEKTKTKLGNKIEFIGFD